MKSAYNKTKIIATIGPATSSKEQLQEIIASGVDVCRLNFSHGTHQDHKQVIDNVLEINEELGTSVALLADLQGPKLRIGKIKGGKIELIKGSTITLTTEICEGTAEKLFVSYEKLASEAMPGELVLLDDGKVELKIIEKVNDRELKAEVIIPGPLTSNKGFNLPNTILSTPSLTEKDIADLEFIVQQDIDWIALSFVRSPQDVQHLKSILSYKKVNARVIAKIEKPQAIEHIDAIIEGSDAIMVARGDLGVEMPMERVPLIQKDIVKKCIANSKPVIIATQMMESMIENPRPTRAEANDVANAVLDGADCVMLSAETSIGKYPIRAVQAVQKILSETEHGDDVYYKGVKPNEESPSFLSDEICFTAVRMSDHINAKAIISMTQTGYTAFKIASFRPQCSIFIFTSNKSLQRMLSLVWNVRVFIYERFESTDASMKDVLHLLKREELVNVNDLVVHTASMPIHERRKTNTLKISRVE